MNKIALAGALSLALASAGCQSTAPTPAVAPIVVAPLPGQTLSIAQVAANDFTKACATWSKAVSYYNDVAFLVPSSVSAPAAIVISGGNAICAAPSSDLQTSLTRLNALWVQIQAYTKVP